MPEISDLDPCCVVPALPPFPYGTETLVWNIWKKQRQVHSSLVRVGFCRRIVGRTGTGLAWAGRIMSPYAVGKSRYASRGQWHHDA
jgi:hypothetical protein